MFFACTLALAFMSNDRSRVQSGSALDAVEAAVKVLEDDPVFNARHGAVFTYEGVNELDAAIMDGRNRAAGAVAGLTRTRNPISAARGVMEKSPHVMLQAPGADRFARERGLDGVICGHIHWASIREIDGLSYINCGDWVASCTAIVEHFDGRLDLVAWGVRSLVPALSAPVVQHAEA